jgi:hypothetical protein
MMQRRHAHPGDLREILDPQRLRIIRSDEADDSRCAITLVPRSGDRAQSLTCSAFEYAINQFPLKQRLRNGISSRRVRPSQGSPLVQRIRQPCGRVPLVVLLARPRRKQACSWANCLWSTILLLPNSIADWRSPPTHSRGRILRGLGNNFAGSGYRFSPRRPYPGDEDDN